MNDYIILNNSTNSFLEEVSLRYQFLYQELAEILKQHYIIDNIQDNCVLNPFLQSTLEYFVNGKIINFQAQPHSHYGLDNIIHKMLHLTLGTYSHSTFGIWLEEYLSHALIKTISFALIFPFQHFINYENKNLDILIEYEGAAPLEAINLSRFYSNGTDDAYSKIIENIALHEKHYMNRANDIQYEQRAKSSAKTAEFTDALTHGLVEFIAFKNYIDKPGVYAAMAAWYLFKYNLYHYTNHANTIHDHKVKLLREKDNALEKEVIEEKEEICSNDYQTSLQETIYTVAKFIQNPIYTYIFLKSIYSIEIYFRPKTYINKEETQLIKYNTPASSFTSSMIEKTAKTVLKSSIRNNNKLKKTFSAYVEEDCKCGLEHTYLKQKAASKKEITSEGTTYGLEKTLSNHEDLNLTGVLGEDFSSN